MLSKSVVNNYKNSGNVQVVGLIYELGTIINGDEMSRLKILAVLILFGSVACTPTVKVQAPDKPIEINMNINIKHEILIKVEKDVEKLLLEDEDLF